MLDMQEVFTKVCNHLLKQGKRCTAKNSKVCVYRNAKGRQCAVGCLIKDEYYSPALEGANVEAPPVRSALYYSGVNTADVNMRRLLGDLQLLHDKNYPKDWPARLRTVAGMYGLVLPPSLVATAQVPPATA